MSQEVFFATAGVVDAQFNVFTEDCLRNMAREDPRCRYDEETKTLWITVEVKDEHNNFTKN